MKKDNQQEHWRWGVDPVWEHVSSMHQESYMAQTATHPFAENHHKRACVYFCIAALEGFVNQKMRAFLEKRQVPENEIYLTLRREKIAVKLKDWPSKVNAPLQKLPDYIHEHFEEMFALRNEITHTKNKDHQIYNELEKINSFWCVKSTNEYMAAFCEALNEEYPYWLLGWNLVGSNHHECQAFYASNADFVWGLHHMGFRIPAADYDLSNRWRKENMSTLRGYQKLWKLLDDNAPDIEPRNEVFPTKPRLTRRWWDTGLVKACLTIPIGLAPVGRS